MGINMTKSNTMNHIPNIYNIPENCRESFLPISGELQQKGMSMAGLSDLESPYKISRSSEWSGLVLYTIEGQAQFRTPEASHTLTAGDLLLISPRYPHQYWAEGNWKIAWFHYCPKAENAFGSQSGTYEIQKGVKADQLISAMNYYVSEAVRETASGQKMMALYGEIITTSLARLLHSDDRDSNYGFHQNRLQKIWEIVNQDLRHQWTVKELAERCHVSSGHFRRIVTSLEHMSPKDKIIRLRLNRAKELITGTELTLEEIAPRVGYSSASILSRTFKKHLGVTPKTLRRT